ncbi:MAG TPA: hypothetical protein VFS64_02065 [Solirubrobacterales bacterium]|nr:hypothetical protein [Solirubrobacterales bacterium]
MSKKLILLALAAVSAALFAMPAVAAAEDEPLHLNPTPSGAQTIDDVTVGNPTLSTTTGETIECGTFHGTATFEAGGTTGHIELTFSEDCRDPGTRATCNSPGAAAGVITTTELPFHQLTLPNSKPGVLVTPNAETGVFAHIECGFGIVRFTVSGNGLVGTITEPACGGRSNMATIDFNATAHGVQEHTRVAGTTETYTLRKGTVTAAEDATGTLTLSGESELQCT